MSVNEKAIGLVVLALALIGAGAVLVGAARAVLWLLSLAG